MKQLRSSLTKKECDEYSEIIFNQLINCKEFQDSKCVLVYMDFKNEVYTKQIIHHALENHKKVYAPKVSGDTMDFFEIHNISDCKPGCMGILEPNDSFEKYDYSNKDQTIMIVPGLAFDHNGNRLGYGGGFYDKYLEQKPNIHKCAIAYDFQYVNEVEIHEKDIKMDMLITEKRIINYD